MVFTNTTEVRDFMLKHEYYIALPESKMFIKGHYASGKLMRATMHDVDIPTDLIALKELDTNENAYVLFSLNYDYTKLQFMSTDDNVEITANMYVAREDIEIMPIAIMTDDKDSSMVTWLLEIGLKDEYIRNSEDYFKDQIAFFSTTKSFIPVYNFPLDFRLNPIISIDLANAKLTNGEVEEYRQSGTGYAIQHQIKVDGKYHTVAMDKSYAFKKGDTVKLNKIGSKSMVLEYNGAYDELSCHSCGCKLVNNRNGYNCLNIDCKSNLKNAMRHIADILAYRQGFDYTKLIHAMVDKDLISSISEMYDDNFKIEQGLLNHGKKRFHLDFKSAIRVKIGAILSAMSSNVVSSEHVQRICDVMKFKVFSATVEDMSEFIPLKSAVAFKQWLDLNYEPVYSLLAKLKCRSLENYPKLLGVLPEEMVGKKIFIKGVYTMYTTKCYLMLTALGATRSMDLEKADFCITTKPDDKVVVKSGVPVVDGAVLEGLIDAYIDADLEDQFYINKV